jgi:hypothetical protein
MRSVLAGHVGCPSALWHEACTADRIMRTGASSFRQSSLWCLVALVCYAGISSAQGETFTGEASLKTAGGVSSTAPVTVVVSRMASDADRDALVAAIKKGGTQAAQAWLAKQPDAGVLQVGARKTPIKYVYRRDTGDGRLLTIATAEPVAFLGGGVPGAKSTTGYLLGVALLTVPSSGAGQGELSPAAKIRVDADGAIVTEDFNPQELVQLTKVTRKS